MIDDRWSASKLRTWHRCPRKFHNNYILGLGEPSSSTQDFGTVGHHRLEGRLLALLPVPTPQRGFMALAGEYEQSRLDAVLAGYDVRWADDGEVYDVLGVEVPFEYELAGSIIQGKMDAIVQRRSDGRVFIVEHKFTGSDVSPGASYFERLALDVQVSVYVDAALAMGYGQVEVLYDVVTKPRHEPRLATPVEDRTMTQGKGCKACGGKAKEAGTGLRPKMPTILWVPDGHGNWIASTPGALLTAALDEDGGEWAWTVQIPDAASRSGRAPSDEAARTAAIVELARCPACEGSGWAEAPRLHKGQRDTDETPAEFYNRIVEDIATRPDDYYARPVVARSATDMVRSRASILDTIRLAKVAETFGAFPMNDQSCFAYNSRCAFFGACTGVEDIGDRNRFPLRTKP